MSKELFSITEKDGRFYTYVKGVLFGSYINLEYALNRMFRLLSKKDK